MGERGVSGNVSGRQNTGKEQCDPQRAARPGHGALRPPNPADQLDEALELGSVSSGL